MKDVRDQFRRMGITIGWFVTGAAILSMSVYLYKTLTGLF